MTTVPRGLLLLGPVVTAWGAGGAVLPEGFVVVVDGRVAALGARGAVPGSARRLPTVRGVVVPAFADAHVHVAFSSTAALRASGVLSARDLGAPLADALAWREAWPALQVAGPLLTAPGGYPTRSWGSAGFGREVGDADEAWQAVAELAAAGVDLVKVAVEPAGGAPTPSLATVRAVVRSAHEQGLPVTCHALTADAVERALDAGVDELCHVPTEPLPEALLDRMAKAGVPVVSTLATHAGTAASANAAALHRRGVPLRYGTDLGNEGTRPGPDPRELRLLSAAGPGDHGALAAAAPGRLVAGEPAALVVLPRDPRVDLDAVTEPLAVVDGSRVTGPTAGAR